MEEEQEEESHQIPHRKKPSVKEILGEESPLKEPKEFVASCVCK